MNYTNRIFCLLLLLSNTRLPAMDILFEVAHRLYDNAALYDIGPESATTKFLRRGAGAVTCVASHYLLKPALEEKKSFKHCLVGSLGLAWGIAMLTKENAVRYPFNMGVFAATFGGSLMAARSYDRGRGVFDFLRTHLAGSALAYGLYKCAVGAYTSNLTSTAKNLMWVLAGALMLSKKDVKQFFGIRAGEVVTCNAVIDRIVTDHCSKDPDAPEELIKIDSRVLDLAKQARKESRTLLSVLRSWIQKSHNKEEGLKNSHAKKRITKYYFATSVLPHLRTENLLNDIKNKKNRLTAVFGIDPSVTATLNNSILHPYVSLDNLKI